MEKVQNRNVLKSNCTGIQMLVEIIRIGDRASFIVRNPQGQPFFDTDDPEELEKMFISAFDCLKIEEEPITAVAK